MEVEIIAGEVFTGFKSGGDSREGVAKAGEARESVAVACGGTISDD